MATTVFGSPCLLLGDVPNQGGVFAWHAVVSAALILFTSQLPIYRDRDCSAWLLVLAWAILGSKPDRDQRVSSSKCPDRLWCSPIGYRQLFPGLKRWTREADPSPASSGEARNEWYACTPVDAVMASRGATLPLTSHPLVRRVRRIAKNDC